MSVIMRNDIEVGGTDDDVIAKVGTAQLTTQADDLSAAVNELNSSLNSLKVRSNDYIKIKAVNLRCNDMTPGMNLTSYVQIDSGYKFFAWQTLGCSNGWISDFPIYISNPGSPLGYPYWKGTLGANYSVLFYYFEIKSNV